MLSGDRLTIKATEAIQAAASEAQRRAAWEASKEIGARVAERVRELARLRNEAAHKLGFGDHYRIALHLQEIDEDWLFGVLDELDRLKTELVPEADLARAKRQILRDFVMSRESTQSLGEQLGYAAVVLKDPDLLDSELDRFLRVTAQDIQRVARRYFVPENSAVVEIYPSERGLPAGEPQGRDSGARIRRLPGIEDRRADVELVGVQPSHGVPDVQAEGVDGRFVVPDGGCRAARQPPYAPGLGREGAGAGARVAVDGP